MEALNRELKNANIVKGKSERVKFLVQSTYMERRAFFGTQEDVSINSINQWPHFKDSRMVSLHKDMYATPTISAQKMFYTNCYIIVAANL